MKLLKSGDLSEFEIQKAIIEWINKHPFLRKVTIHIPNEGKRNPITGYLLKILGLRKGVSDLFIATQRHGYGGAWIEIKSKNGRLSKEQKLFIEDMNNENYFTYVPHSIDEAIDIIQWYCFK